MRSILSVLKKKSPITLSIFALILLSNQTIPLFLPLFRPKIVFPGCLCSCSLLRKRKKSENRDFSKKPINTDFFTYSPHRVNISVTYPHIDTRQDGYSFLKWTYFSIRVMPCFLLVYRHLVHFCNKKEDFPHFQKEGNPSIFIDFWPFSAVFLTQQHHRLNMCRLDARNMSTECIFQQVYWKLKTTLVV